MSTRIDRGACGANCPCPTGEAGRAFRSQFPYRIELPETVKRILRLEHDVFGYKVYRCLDRLLLLDSDGEYYSARSF